MEKTFWAIDPTHSEIQFKVKHLVISTVTGSFKTFDAKLESQSEDFANSNVSFEADTASIFTNNEQRDAHLRSADFFDADNHPKMKFASKSFVKKGSDKYSLLGDLTIRDTTKEVELDVEFGGLMVDPWGNTKIGFEAQGKLNRKDYGLNWNAITEAGGVMVSEEVKLILNVQFAKQA